MAIVNRTIFRAYDVRGFTRGGNINLTPQVAYHVGMALGSRRKVGETVLLSGDHRSSTLPMLKEMAKGYQETGVNVHLSYDPVPTAGNNWYLITRKYDGAVQIAGSHNPPEYNGFKISEGLQALHGNELQDLIPSIEYENYRRVGFQFFGKLKEVDINSPYFKMLSGSTGEFNHPWRVILDAHHGLGGGLKEVLEAKGVEVHPLYVEPDGEFPRGPADPSRIESIQEALALAAKLNQNLKPGEIPWINIFIDGDADRSGFGDENGKSVDPEKMASIFYRDYLLRPENQGHFMAMDVRSSSSAEQIVKQYGGKGIFIQAGYPAHRMFGISFIPEIGKDHYTGRSSEASGHHFNPTGAFNENGNAIPWGENNLIDDGLYSALLFLDLLDKADQNPAISALREPGKKGRFTLAEFMSTIPSKPTSLEIRTPCPDGDKFGIIGEIEAHFKANPEGLRRPLGSVIPFEGLRLQWTNQGLILVDGVRVQYEDGSFALIRASNTSPMLTFKFEAQDESTLLQRMVETRELLKKYPSIELDLLEKAIADQSAKAGSIPL